MLSHLEIENYMSIRDTQVVDLHVGGHVEEQDRRFAPAWRDAPYRVPKVVALFGPNASGKSTVLRTLALLSWFVQHSFQLLPNATIPAEPSWSDGNPARSTRLAVQFSGPDNISTLTDKEAVVSAEECRYVYEVQFGDHKGRRIVVFESLHFWPKAATRRVRLFERENNAVVAGKEFHFAGHRAVLSKILRDNASVVATLAQLGHKPSLLLRDSAARIFSNIFIEKQAVNDMAMLQFYQQHPDVLAAVNRDRGRIDLGIRAMSIETSNDGPRALFEHEGLTRPVPLQLESHGTRQFLQIYPLLDLALRRGGVAVIDEMDLAIHPLVLPEILRWFYEPTRNPRNAQLWITCQNVSLLEELTKEEIFFCSKDSTGGTSIYGLSEIVGVRRADNYYRKYLGGVYGAVPNLG
jgi:energy-coupling factor transporter ATP-binding protein EcfA2